MRIQGSNAAPDPEFQSARLRARPGAQQPFRHSAAAPDTDPVARGLSEADSTRIRPRRALVPSCVPIRGLRDHLRRFTPPSDLHTVLGGFGLVVPTVRTPWHISTADEMQDGAGDGVADEIQDGNVAS